MLGALNFNLVSMNSNREVQSLSVRGGRYS